MPSQRASTLAACCALWTGLHAGTVWSQEPVTPPQVVTKADAVYPAEALAAGREGTVTLLVTVDPDGSVGAAEVHESAGADLDEAALAAVRQWRFSPALRGVEPVRARIRVPFLFALPAAPDAGQSQDAGAPMLAAGPAEPDGGAPERDAGTSEQAAIDVTVQGERRLRAEERGASSFTIGKPVLDAAPRQEGAEALRTVPGLYIARSEGLAVAHRYSLRGFDADHGQDIEFRVGGIPINMPAHLHGQGYADLGFLIGETVDELVATEGVYDPRQGDFAVAGTVEARLGIEKRGWHAKTAYGRFNNLRLFLAWAPEGQPRSTFGAVQYNRTDGFGENRSGDVASAIAQVVLGTGAWRFRTLGILYGARAELAGVVRADDVEAGRIGFYDVYPYATARGQNALAARLLLGAFAEYRGSSGENAEAGVWFGADNFRIQQNFTGFIHRSRTLANVAGRGDLIEQQNRTFSAGLNGRYRSRAYRPTPWASGTVELGLSGRIDAIDQAQYLIDANVRGQTWDRRVDASVFGADVGFFGDLDWKLTRWVHVRVGVRGDALLFDVNDRLGNFATLVRPKDAYIVGYRRSAFGLAMGPRASVEVRPTEQVSIRAAYGEGYRSPQARTLDDGENAPFTKVRSADLGVRFEPSEKVQLSLAGYFTHLSDDVAFHPDEGRLERIGETQRVGAVFHGQARPWDWAVAALSVTYVHAQLLQPPPASADDPVPPYQPGQSLPFVPPVVVRLDLGARPTLVRALFGKPLVGRAGLGFSYLSPRPLPYGAFAEPVGLLDGSVGVGWGPLELSFEAFNLLNARYAATELNFPSAWDPDAPRQRTPERHLVAGAPFSWWVTLGVTL